MVAAAVIGASVVGAGASIASSAIAADAQKDAARDANDLQRYFYDTNRADQAPWRETGGAAVGVLGNLYGVNGPEAQTQAYEDFQTSPGYQFRVDEAMKAIDRRASAGGYWRDPRAEKEMARYVSDYVAGPEFNSYANRLAALAGIGQTSAAQTGAAGANAANAMSANLQYAGNASAQNAYNVGSAINQGVGNVAQWYLYNQGLNGGGGAGASTYGMNGPGSISPVGLAPQGGHANVGVY